LNGISGMAQDDLPDFHPPVDLPIFLSGNFAEIRRNHFHTGIDIKTAGVEGQLIRAAEGGKVTRIAISPWGYGKVLYVEHDNGYTTVYAHLSSFSEKIDAVARAEQYRQASYAIDFTPESPPRVERAELIALSGNSGSSGGPHLHFEIRKTANSRAQNPLHFGFAVADKIAPRIRGVRFHPLTDTSLVNGNTQAKSFVVQGDAGKYHLKAGQSIKVYGTFGLSLHALDFLDGQSNKCGIYSLELEVDGKLVCKQQFDELDFATSRQINCYKDYGAYRNSGWHYHKSFIEPGNQLDIYPLAPPDSGRIHFAESGIHQVRYTSTDAHGNVSVLEFQFESIDKPNGAFASPEPYDAYFYRDQDNTFDYGEELQLKVPAFALYNDLKFQFGREMPTDQSLTPYYSLHYDLEPLDKYIEVRISMKDIPLPLRSKAIAARYAAVGSPAYVPGKIEGDDYVISVKDFGRFCLMADSVAPKLTANKYSRGGAINDRSVLGFNIDDNRSGIKHYEGRLNGKWTLMEYEPKKKLLFMTVKDAAFQKGSNTLEVDISDQCGNVSSQRFTYNY
jgi:hypothetical protein